jgi:hypothetical protein
VTLIERYEKLSIEYTCATNSISHIAQLEKSNCELKAQVEDLTSKHVGLQEKYDDLSCTHAKLVDSHATLDIAHEVMKTSVKSYQPHMYKCICSQVRIDLSYANPCCSQENISPSTISDLYNVGENEKHKGHGHETNSDKKNKSNKVKNKGQMQNRFLSLALGARKKDTM